MKNPILAAGIVSLTLLPFNQHAASAESSPVVVQAVFRITDHHSSGTCFLVAPVATEYGQEKTVMVTAAHALEGMRGDSCQLVLRKKTSEGTFLRKEVTVPIRDQTGPKWRKHPDLDIAALPVELPAGADVTPLSWDQIADRSFVASDRVKIGQVCFIPCYPAQMEANKVGWPVMRRGSFASYPMPPLSQARSFLVDYRAFGGDSGAPVFLLPQVNGEQTKPRIVGIIVGMHRQTDKSVMPFEERTMHTPLGLGIAVHACFIRETINLLSASGDEGADGVTETKTQEKGLNRVTVHGARENKPLMNANER